MFAFLIEPNTSNSILELTGLEIEKNDNNNFDVVNLTFMGPAEKKGIQFYDEVTKIEISSLDRPPKEYIYLFGVGLLMFVIYSQRKRIKKSV